MALLGTSRTLSSGLRMLSVSISPMRVGSCRFSTTSIAAMTATATTTTATTTPHTSFAQSMTTTGTATTTMTSTANRSMSGMSAAASMTENFKKFSYFSGLKQTVKSDLKQMTGLHALIGVKNGKKASLTHKQTNNNRQHRIQSRIEPSSLDNALEVLLRTGYLSSSFTPESSSIQSSLPMLWWTIESICVLSLLYVVISL